MKKETIHKHKIKSFTCPACDRIFSMVPWVNPLSGKMGNTHLYLLPVNLASLAELQIPLDYSTEESDSLPAQIIPHLSPSCICTKKFIWCKPNWVMFSTGQRSPSGFCAITEMKFIFHVTTAEILYQGLILPFCSSKPHAEVKIFILLMFV